MLNQDGFCHPPPTPHLELLQKILSRKLGTEKERRILRRILLRHISAPEYKEEGRLTKELWELLAQSCSIHPSNKPQENNSQRLPGTNANYFTRYTTTA